MESLERSGLDEHHANQDLGRRRGTREDRDSLKHDDAHRGGNQQYEETAAG